MKQGFSLMGSIVSLVIMGIVAFLMVQFFNDLQKKQSRLTSQGELVDFETIVRMVLSNERACNESILTILPVGALAYNKAGGNPSITSMNLANSGQTLFMTGTALPNFTVNSARFLSGTVLDTQPMGAFLQDIVLSELSLQVKVTQKNFVSENKFPIRILIQRPSTSVTPGVGQIIGCQANFDIVSRWFDAGAAVLTSAAGASPTKGNVIKDKVTWRRVGDTMELQWRYEHNTVGSNGGGTTLFNLPPGYRIDTTKLPVPNALSENVPIGIVSMEYSNGHCSGTAFAYNDRQFAIRLGCMLGGGAGAGWVPTYAGWNYADRSYFVDVKVPILGW